MESCLFLRLNHKSAKKLIDFSGKKIVMAYIDIEVLDQCCCAKNIVKCLWIILLLLLFHEFDEMA